MYPPPSFVQIVTEKTSEEVDVLVDGKRRIEIFAEALWHVGDAWAGIRPMRCIGHVAAEHLYATFLDRLHSRDQREQTGFSDAVRSDQTDRQAGRNDEIDAVERSGLSKAEADAFEPRNERPRRRDR